MKYAVLSLILCGVLGGGAREARAQAVTFQVQPTHVTADAGKSVSVKARIAITGAVGQVAKVWANVGKFGAVKALGKGMFETTWTSPVMGFPTVAILRADVKVGGKLLRRWLQLPVSVRTPIPVQAQKGEHIQIVVGGKDFGPVKVKRTGTVSVPVVVDPGAGSYTINRTDEYNVTKSDTRRFGLPPFKRIVVVGPKDAQAGDIITLEAFQISSRGTQYAFSNPLIINCPGANLEEIIGRKSVQRFRLKLTGRTGEIICRVFMKVEPKVQTAFSFEVDVSKRLLLKLSAAPRVLRLNSAKTVMVNVTVSDLFGNISDTADLKVTANGKPVTMSRTGAGQYRGWLYSPRDRQPKDRVVVRASAPEAKPTEIYIRLLGDLATRVSVRVKPRRLLADGKKTVLVEVTALDQHGMPAKDRKVRIESDQGKMLFVHRVHAGLFRGRFRPTRNDAGGVAVITAQTYRAPAVQVKLRLDRAPQRWLITPVVGSFGDFLRTVGIGLSLRFEWAAYRGRPNVFIGGALQVSPHFTIEDSQGALKDTQGLTAGAVALARLRLVSTRRFALDVSMDAGVLGLYSSYREQYGSLIQRNNDARAVFTVAAGLEAAVVTTGQQEFFGLLQVRYLTGRFEDAVGENRVTLLGGIGYRFSL